MVAISFSVFRSKLEDGTKAQTGRLWKPQITGHNKKDYSVDEWQALALKMSTKPKKEHLIKNRINEGDKIQVYWKQRQKKVFKLVRCCLACRKKYSFTKSPLRLYPETHVPPCELCGMGPASQYGVQISGSEKLMDAIVTETFLVKMWADKITTLDDVPYSPGETECIAQCDGFEDDVQFNSIPVNDTMAVGYKPQTAAEKFFMWFDKAHDLSTPKIIKFIRWRRLI